MPHILSSDALDLLFNLEMAGRAIPNDEVWFDGSINPGATKTIQKDATVIAGSLGVNVDPVFFLALLKIDNDPLLDTIQVQYKFKPPIRPMTMKYTSRNASATIHTFALPMSNIQLDLAATATDSAGTTVRALYDVMSAGDAALFAQLGTQTLKQVEGLLQELLTEGRKNASMTPDMTNASKLRTLQSRTQGGPGGR